MVVVVAFFFFFFAGRQKDRNTDRNRQTDSIHKANRETDKVKMPKTLVEQVESFFYEDPKFQNSMESFARKHCDIIDLSTEENKLEYV